MSNAETFAEVGRAGVGKCLILGMGCSDGWGWFDDWVDWLDVGSGKNDSSFPKFGPGGESLELVASGELGEKKSCCTGVWSGRSVWVC